MAEEAWRPDRAEATRRPPGKEAGSEAGNARERPITPPGGLPVPQECGQATVELVAALPALLLAALLALQLLAAGYALTLADGAAEAGALALATGDSASEAVRGSLPGWAEDDVAVEVEGGRVSVRLRPPSPFEAIAERLEVTSSASARPER